MKRKLLRPALYCLAAGILAAGPSAFPAMAEEDITILDQTGETALTEAGGEAEENAAAEESADAETDTNTEENADTKESLNADEDADEDTDAEVDEIVGQMIFAQCEDYINVRQGPGKDSEVVGKIYNNCMATVLGKSKKWYEIQSGNVVGFVKAKFFATGAEAEAIAAETAGHVATIFAEELNIRELPDESSEVVGVAYRDETFEAVSYENDWIQVALGDDVYGYINAYYASYDTYYPVAETLEEEQARLYPEPEAEEEPYYEDTDEGGETYYEESWDSVTTGSSGGTDWSQGGGYTQPETQAPQTEAQTQAPQTEAPPQTEAQTQAPQTEAPQTEVQPSTSPDAGNDDMYYDADTGEMKYF